MKPLPSKGIDSMESSTDMEEIREVFGRRCWIQYMPHAGAIEVRDIGWAG